MIPASEEDLANLGVRMGLPGGIDQAVNLSRRGMGWFAMAGSALTAIAFAIIKYPKITLSGLLIETAGSLLFLGVIDLLVFGIGKAFGRPPGAVALFWVNVGCLTLAFFGHFR